MPEASLPGIAGNTAMTSLLTGHIAIYDPPRLYVPSGGPPPPKIPKSRTSVGGSSPKVPKKSAHIAYLDASSPHAREGEFRPATPCDGPAASFAPPLPREGPRTVTLIHPFANRATVPGGGQQQRASTSIVVVCRCVVGMGVSLGGARPRPHQRSARWYSEVELP
ncbi:hypothetical protein CKAH01_12055 [Colletotrichum kahawae]|uniref:Uncharacterized protein n=1 Tax=Colletotrichum kahawae TaxID=34407 RepID=A0AAD9YUI8_COLKA|nr:hypothetical protein CKAH01_12055 [Colletotrichum kahawae]